MYGVVLVRSARKHPWTMRRQTMAVSLTVLVFSSFSASAATLANRDDKDHKVTIIEGDAKADQTLKPQQIVDKICPKGCVVRLNDSEDDEYQIDPEDMVSIEDGYLYHDAPEPPANAPAPAAPAPKQ
jgi:hypothetical protein